MATRDKSWEVWPLYFAAKPLDSRLVKLKKGQPFPRQDKFFIRGLARAYGVENVEGLPMDQLPYVAVLNVWDETLARSIVERKVALDDAQKLVKATVSA